MTRTMDQRRVWFALPSLKGAALAVGVLSFGVVAVAQMRTIPDAQVEASVLKSLAGAPDLANQAITTTTVYGVVTLSGSVTTEALRVEAETLASKTAGVKKVVDELTLGAAVADGQPSGSASGDGATNPNLQSDGTMAPMVQGSPNSDNTAQGSIAAGQASGPAYGPGAPEYRRAYNAPGYPQTANGQQPSDLPEPGYTSPPAPGYGQQESGQQQQPGYGRPQQPGYGQQQPGYGPPQRGYAQQRQAYGGPQQPVYGGQEAGQTVTVPSGAMLRIRVNQALDSGHTQPGTTFDGVVVSDVVADGAVAIPRGATVQGKVVDAKKSGVLLGRGELSLRLMQVTMGGKVYPIVSDVWAHNGGDKTIQTVNSTAIGGGVGALFGAAAGGGEGAAIGAGIGAALGLGSSAASGRGQVYVPSEGMLTFHITQPATIATVSQAEMDRLAQGVGPQGQPRQLQRRYPVYYVPGYYRPYPYPY